MRCSCIFGVVLRNAVGLVPSVSLKLSFSSHIEPLTHEYVRNHSFMTGIVNRIT